MKKEERKALTSAITGLHLDNVSKYGKSMYDQDQWYKYCDDVDKIIKKHTKKHKMFREEVK